jgi:hypothetical protein
MLFSEKFQFVSSRDVYLDVCTSSLDIFHTKN